MDIIKTFATITTAFSVFSNPFSTVQKETIFDNRYQNVNFIIQPFEKSIELPTFGTEFTFTLEIETMFTVESSIYSLSSKTNFSINIVF